jgi:hypothetical protein
MDNSILMRMMMVVMSAHRVASAIETRSCSFAGNREEVVVAVAENRRQVRWWVEEKWKGEGTGFM